MQTTLPTTARAKRSRTLRVGLPALPGRARVGDEAASCATCGPVLRPSRGIWRFRPERTSERLATFVREYETVRAAEGWQRDRTGPTIARCRKFPTTTRTAPSGTGGARELIDRLLERHRAARSGRASARCVILDLGAGNCWLAIGSPGAAIGRRCRSLTNDWDGLGAQSWYHDDAEPAPFTPSRPASIALPFRGRAGRPRSSSTPRSITRRTTPPPSPRPCASCGPAASSSSWTRRSTATLPAARGWSASARRTSAGAYGFSGDTLANEAYLTDARLGRRRRGRWE